MPKRRASSIESGDIAPTAPKKTKSAVVAPAGKDDDGCPFWELSSKRRVGVSKFKQMCLVNVREYYEQDGKTLPGKKGISLSVEQYKTFLKLVPAINASLEKMGHVIDSGDEDMDDAPEPPKLKVKKEKKPSKSNIDATSDEDDDED